MLLTYSGKSAPSANAIADCDDDILIVRRSSGDINWGRNRADTKLNPDISNVTNKRVMRALFKEHGVPMPKLLSEYEVASELYSGKAVVGRPDRHTRGRGFWKCTDRQQVLKALRGTRTKRAATHFMEYIDAPREYRVHVFMDKSIRISEKQFDGADKSKYTTVKPTHSVNHVRQAAKDAVKAVGLDFGAVDILADDNKCWVLEVNAAPGLGGSMPRLYAATFKQYMRSQL